MNSYFLLYICTFPDDDLIGQQAVGNFLVFNLVEQVLDSLLGHGLNVLPNGCQTGSHIGCQGHIIKANHSRWLCQVSLP